MIYSWLVPPRYYVLLGGSLLFAFLLGWFFLSQAADSSMERTREMVWELPPDLQEELIADIEFLKQKGFFGEASDIPDDQDLDLSQGWRALGVISSDEGTSLLIKSDNGDVKTMKEGDMLPDDRIIVQIEKDLFSVEKEGKVEEIRLYPMTAEEMHSDGDDVVDAEDVLEDSAEDEVPVARPQVPLQSKSEELELDEDTELDEMPKDIRATPPPIPQDLLDALEEDDDLF